MSCIESMNGDKDDSKTQLSDIERSFHSIKGQISGSFLRLDGSPYHEPLVTLLVGIGFILHSFGIFLAISQVRIQTLVSLYSKDKVHAVDKSNAVALCDAEPSGHVAKASDIQPASPTSESTSAKPTFSPKDIILRRLTMLKEERHVAPMIFKTAISQDTITCIYLMMAGVDCDIPGPCGRSLAHIAAMTGNLSLLTYVIISSLMIWSKCSQGKTPLDYAAFNNHLEIVTFLIEDKHFPLFTDDEKLAILERSSDFAQSRGHISVANYLSERSQCIRLARNEELFLDAVSKNNLNKVKRLLKEGISERSAVSVACKKGYRFIPLVSILLSSTINGFFYDIGTAINYACTSEQKDFLVLLLCSIDDDSQREIEMEDAYRHSLASGKLEICQFLVSCGELDIEYAFRTAADYTNQYLLQWLIEEETADRFHGALINRAFHTAVLSRPTVPFVKFLVENGADVNSKQAIWGTALQCAAAKDCLDLVHYLVSEAGADINAHGQFGGSSPMMAAISGGYTFTFRYFLLKFRFCFSEQHGVFGNVLQTASYLGRREILEDILSNGFDINARREPYGSALIMAIQGGHFGIAELLISRGADVHLSIPKYGTALHLAAAAGRENIVRLLIQAGADVNAEGGDFCTPLQAAAANGHQMVVLFLVDCGAQVNTQGGKYGNAWSATREEGNSPLSEFLLFSGAAVI